MPSPFPGMDPYLEGARWMGVHAQLSVELARQLGPQIRPKYVALIEERVVVDVVDFADGDRDRPTKRRPDVALVATGVAGALTGGEPAAAPLRVATIVPEAVTHFAVEIRDTADKSIVTSIEILSPTNKRGGGYEAYLSRRGQVLHSEANLVEVDLLRTGERVPMRQPLPSTAFFAFVGRRELRPITEIWPINLREALPRIPIPLRRPDPDVWVDLQRAFTTVYDSVGYELILDYSSPPEVALSDEDATWADDRLRAAGLRA
jgi:hypothetical protein